MESGYFGGKSLYFNEKSLKMQNRRNIIVSSLYIAILLLFRSLRYYLSTKNVNENLPRKQSGYFWGESWYFNEKTLKTGKSQIHCSFFLIHCNVIII